MQQGPELQETAPALFKIGGIDHGVGCRSFHFRSLRISLASLPDFQYAKVEQFGPLHQR
jgi:hypothetical protein